MINANPNLKVIASMAIIPAGIDVACATARKIPVTTIPAVVAEDTADLAWGLILAVSRNIVRGDRTLREGIFPGSEAALAEALRKEMIAGAALDVYENEPRVHPELIGFTNVVLTPHLGSAVSETREGMAMIVAANIVAVMEGRRPPNIFNPEIY